MIRFDLFDYGNVLY